MITELIAGVDDAGRRLDRILRKALPEMPLSGIHRLLRTGQVRIDGAPADGADRVQAGAVIGISGGVRRRSAAGDTGARHRSAAAANAGAYILWESPDLLILNKPAGLAVHGPEKSLDRMVQAYLAGKTAESLSFKPGPLHRLDQPTSGVIVFSKTLAGARYFSGLMQEGRVKKEYLALVDGQIREPAVWRDPLLRDTRACKSFITPQSGAAHAETAITPLGAADCYSLIRAEIRTGKTHQIRAQAQFHSHPLAGDAKYGGSVQAQGFLLHAYRLGFPENPPPGLPQVLTAPLPDRFRRRVHALFGDTVVLSLGQPARLI